MSLSTLYQKYFEKVLKVAEVLSITRKSQKMSLQDHHVVIFFHALFAVSICPIGFNCIVEDFHELLPTRKYSYR